LWLLTIQIQKDPFT